jgi:hypothetical protein
MGTAYTEAGVNSNRLNRGCVNSNRLNRGCVNGNRLRGSWCKWEPLTRKLAYTLQAQAQSTPLSVYIPSAQALSIQTHSVSRPRTSPARVGETSTSFDLITRADW